MTTDVTQDNQSTTNVDDVNSSAEKAIDNVVGDQIEQGEDSIFKSKAKIQSEGAVLDEDGQTVLPKEKEGKEKMNKIWGTLGGLLFGSLIVL